MEASRSLHDARLLEVLERLLAFPAGDLKAALTFATDLVAEAFHADKVDAFLYEAERDSLVAVGSSDQPLSRQQRKHGLDVLPLSNGGRVVYVYQTGKTFLTGDLQHDAEELRGVKEALGIRSKLGVPLRVRGAIRGMMMIASLRDNFFTEADARFAEAVAVWVGETAQRVEMIEEIARNAVEQGRRKVAEELITVLAHDLRGYLTPIQFRLGFVQRRAERDGRKDDYKDAELSLKGLARVSSMIGRMLDVARIDQGVFQVDVKPVDLHALIDEVVKALSTAEKPIQMLASEEMVIAADPERVAQSVENLLSNALKHSPAGAVVTVELARVNKEDGEWAEVHVIDQGPGVPPEMQARIFERYVTGARRSGGLGLGLYLAKPIAALHGGDLSVESTPGKGARFTLRLPILSED